MSFRNASRLDAGLIARKGEATPAGAPSAVPDPKDVRSAGSEDVAAPPPGRGLHGTIAVTVRLDPERYRRLKSHGVDHRLTNQEILVKALDAYMNGKY